MRPLRQVLINIHGIPAHLCSEETVKAFLKTICRIEDITINNADHVYQLMARTHDLNTIPTVAHLGVRKVENGELFLLIWPIWFYSVDVTHEDDLYIQMLQQEEDERMQEDQRVGMPTLHMSFIFTAYSYCIQCSY